MRVGLRRLERDGIDGLSMSDVAAEAESSIGALYFRFGDKDQFVGAILAHALGETRDKMAALLDAAETENWPIDRIIEAWVGTLIDVVRKRRALLRIVIRQALARPEAIGPIRSVVIEVRERLIAVLGGHKHLTNSGRLPGDALMCRHAGESIDRRAHLAYRPSCCSRDWILTMRSSPSWITALVSPPICSSALPPRSPSARISPTREPACGT